MQDATKEKKRRVTTSLPEATVRLIDQYADAAGVTRWMMLRFMLIAGLRAVHVTQNVTVREGEQ